MKRRFVFFAMAALFLTGLLFAADVTGNWTGTMVFGDNQIPLTYTFKQEGAKLTGTVASPQGDLPLADGKVEGDKMTFSVTVDMGGNATKFTMEGAIKEEEISLVTSAPNFTSPPMILKRVK